MEPAAVALERQDGAHGVREQIAIVGDDQHGLAGRGDRRLQSPLARNVEEVVGLVEEEDLGVGREEDLEHQALALTARQGGGEPACERVEPLAHDAPAGRVPASLELVAAELGPIADRGAERHPGGLVSVGHGSLGCRHAFPGGPEGSGRELEQLIPHGRPVGSGPHSLRHVGDTPAGRGLPLLGRELTRQHPQQRGLAYAVGADHPDVRPRSDPKRHAGEEPVTARMGVGEV